MTLNCINPLLVGSPFKFSGAKRVLSLAPGTHLNHQEIVYLENINEIVDCIFTNGLKMPNLVMALTQVLTRAPTTFLHSSHGIQTLFRSLRPLKLYARQFASG